MKLSTPEPDNSLRGRELIDVFKLKLTRYFINFINLWNLGQIFICFYSRYVIHFLTDTWWRHDMGQWDNTRQRL